MKETKLDKVNTKETVDYSKMSYDELSEISRQYHQQFSNEYDKQQSALCLVAIGGLCLICAIIFFILSFTRVMNKTGILDTGALQFYVCVACACAAAILLTIGLVRFFIAFGKRKGLRAEINAISKVKKEAVNVQK